MDYLQMITAVIKAEFNDIRDYIDPIELWVYSVPQAYGKKWVTNE